MTEPGMCPGLEEWWLQDMGSSPEDIVQNVWGLNVYEYEVNL